MNAQARFKWDADDKEMILIPGGSLLMGSDEGPAKHQPQHSIQVEIFYIDRFPVTNEEYKRFVDETGHPVPFYDVSWCDTQGYNWDPETRAFPEGKDDHPVVLVKWTDALAYARWAGKRLPTEAEWELAARGLDGRIWPWGNRSAPGRSNTLEAGVGATTSVQRHVPYGASPEGVADMIGNVWEWTSSLFRPYPYDAHDGRETLKTNGWRVLRGGSWVNDLYTARTYTRLDGDFILYSNVGFRCATSLPVLSRDEAGTDGSADTRQ
jgi:formylglycine-generating enzyme required for sulfatase activity